MCKHRAFVSNLTSFRHFFFQESLSFREDFSFKDIISFEMLKQ